MNLKISVIVTTHNRKEGLKEILNSLFAQTYKPFEIIVVDNASTDGTMKFLEKNFEGRIRMVREERIGHSYARNCGIQVSHGDVLAFIDDDALADKEWLLNIDHTFEETGADGVGGKALPLWEKPPPAYLRHSLKAQRYIGIFDLGDKIRQIGDYLIGTNMAFKKEVFKRFGLFDTKVGRTGRRLTGSDDVEFCNRIIPNARIFYDPRIIVRHKMPVSRTKISYLIKIAFSNGLSKAYFPRGLRPQGKSDFWGIDGLMSLASVLGYGYGKFIICTYDLCRHKPCAH